MSVVLKKEPNFDLDLFIDIIAFFAMFVAIVVNSPLTALLAAFLYLYTGFKARSMPGLSIRGQFDFVCAAIWFADFFIRIIALYMGHPHS